jgi:hypothetical protein
MTKEKKIKTLITLYDFEEILEIIGYQDESNPDLDYEGLDKLYDKSESEFESKILDYAIENGNFEESIKTGIRHEL